MNVNLLTALAIATLLMGGQPTQAQPTSVTTYTFDQDETGRPAKGFSPSRTGQGRQGRWVVKMVEDAPSGRNVFAQVDEDRTDYRFPVAIAPHASLRDVRLSVKCKSVSGRLDQACGLVFRYQDPNNYYITRSNPLEDNVRLYHVVNGRRVQIGDWSGKVTAGEWHDFRVEAKGDHIQVFWNGQRVIDTHDRTFNEAGKVGLWTKADSVSYFDDLRVEPLGNAR